MNLGKQAITAAIPGSGAALGALNSLGFTQSESPEDNREAWENYVQMSGEAFEHLAANITPRADQPVEANRLATNAFQHAMKRAQQRTMAGGQRPMNGPQGACHGASRRRPSPTRGAHHGEAGSDHRPEERPQDRRQGLSGARGDASTRRRTAPAGRLAAVPHSRPDQLEAACEPIERTGHHRTPVVGDRDAAQCRVGAADDKDEGGDRQPAAARRRCVRAAEAQRGTRADRAGHVACVHVLRHVHGCTDAAPVGRTGARARRLRRARVSGDAARASDTDGHRSAARVLRSRLWRRHRPRKRPVPGRHAEPDAAHPDSVLAAAREVQPDVGAPRGRTSVADAVTAGRPRCRMRCVPP